MLLLGIFSPVIWVCLVAALEDIGITGSELELSAEQTKMLIKIADDRAAEFKRYVVKVGGVESSRMLLCTAEFETEAGKQPRIKFSI